MDTAERDDRVMTIAAEALKKPLTERESFLRAVCQNDSDLYEEVSEVVTWEERMSTFLSSPLIDLIDVDSLDKPFEPQQKIAGRFDIIREIGDGGMGVVYEAYDNTREQRIAIKCAKPGFSRLQSPELNGALKVRHPNVCQLNDIHMASTDLGEVRFITMELLDGETLQSRLLRGKLASDEAMKIARQLCAGLAEAHRCGVVHGDLKPANIILTQGENNETRAVITDFGLAVNQGANTVLLGGTPSYMAPELKKGSRVSTASDVYALGAILYEMVAGQKPFPASSSQKTAENNGGASAATSIPVEKQQPAHPSKLIKNLPQIWDDAILLCLAPLPEKRLSAKQVIAVLERAPVSFRPWFSKVAVAAVVVLAAGAFLWRPVYNYFHPTDVKLAILPVQGNADIAPAAKAAYDSGNNYLALDDSNSNKAIALFQEAAELDPHSPLPLAGLAEAYIVKRHSGATPQVESKIQSYVAAAARLNPDSPRVLLASSSLNVIQRKYAQAEHDAARVLEFEPGNAEAWVRFGFANEMDDSLDQAREAYLKAIKLDPHYYKPYQYLGAFYYYSQPNYAESEKFYVKAKELAPSRLEGDANMGALLTAQAEYSEAEKIYRNALRTQETPENLNNLGVNLAYERRDKEAIPITNAPFNYCLCLIFTILTWPMHCGGKATFKRQMQAIGKPWLWQQRTSGQIPSLHKSALTGPIAWLGCMKVMQSLK